MKELIKKILRETVLITEKKKKKSKTKKDACYHKVKARYDVWPSAYASGALSKCRKVGAANWGKSTTKEEFELNEIEIDRSNQSRTPGEINVGGKNGCQRPRSRRCKKRYIQCRKNGNSRDFCRDFFGLDNLSVASYENDYLSSGGLGNANPTISAMDSITSQLNEKRKLTSKPSSENSLRDWFKRKGEKGSTGGWVDCNAPDGKGGYKSCGRKSGEERKKYPACRPTPSACKTKGKGKKWGKKSKKESIQEQLTNFTRWGELIVEAEYKGRKVKLNKPTRGDVKKFKVYVKNDKGNVVKVNFGHGGTSAKKKGEKTMKIRKNNPKARKSFRARHNCDNPGPKWKARYWSCRAW